MDCRAFQSLFPLGSHLCREPMPPMAELVADMENLCEELIERARRLDLAVYLDLTCEQAPPWLWRAHPGCHMVGRNGLPIAYEARTTLPADGKPGPCYDPPGAREAMVRFITALVKALSCFENVVVWNIWQEIGYWADGLAGQPVCCCPHPLAFFREYLQAKYGDLAGLNRAWRARYAAREDVAPDRAQAGRSCLPHDVDWRYFMENVHLARILETRYRAVREADRWQRPLFAGKGAPAAGAGQDWTCARMQDFLGPFCYPVWGVAHLGRRPSRPGPALRPRRRPYRRTLGEYRPALRPHPLLQPLAPCLGRGVSGRAGQHGLSQGPRPVPPRHPLLAADQSRPVPRDRNPHRRPGPLRGPMGRTLLPGRPPRHPYGGRAGHARPHPSDRSLKETYPP
ncbi:MAG: beta-galactosidase [Armatimonadetes bacterium]|nr:beta-galactosidase [Armatimonadota bacterium]